MGKEGTGNRARKGGSGQIMALQEFLNQLEIIQPATQVILGIRRGNFWEENLTEAKIAVTLTAMQNKTTFLIQ